MISPTSKVISFFNLLGKEKLAFIIIFLITSIYLHPIFLGKVDTTTDIRDVRMYPWRYHEMDKKIRLVTLWEGVFSVPTFKLTTPPNSSENIVFKISLNDIALQDLKKLSESNYYFSLDFRSIYDKSVAFDFGIKLVNKLSKVSFTPGVAVFPLSLDKNEINPWYKAQFTINNLLAHLKNVSDLNQFELQVITKNKSPTSPATLYLKNLKLICEDFSSVKKVHNHYNNDLIQMFTPFREYYSSNLKKGRMPFWNNYILTGAEFLAEPQIGYFHPLNLLFYFLFDHFTAHSLITFLCLFLCGVGAFLLATYWGLSFGSALLCGIVYMFQPFNITWLSYGHMVLNCATLPFLLLSYEKNIKENKLLNKYLLVSALLLGFIFLSGHLQYIHYTTLFFFLFIVFRFFLDVTKGKTSYIKHIFSGIFIFVISLMIGAVVVIPFLSLFQNSHRVPNPDSFIKNTSIPLKAFLGVLYPYYQGYPDWPFAGLVDKTVEFQKYKSGFFRNYVYFGLVPFLFSLFTLAKIFKNSLVSFFYLVIAFSILMCTGSPLFFLLKDFVPGFSEMQHYRLIMLYSYSVPFLSAFGFQFFLNYFPKLTYKTKHVILAAVIILSTIDLMFYSSYFITWTERKDYKPIHSGGVLEYLINAKNKSKEPFRVLPFVSHKVEGAVLKPDIAEPNTLLSYGLEDVSGYSSFIDKDIYYIYFYIQAMDKNKLYSGEIFDLFSNINTPYPISNFHSMILDLLNVKYFLVPNFITIDSSKVKKVLSSDCIIYENKNYLPRAFFVPNYRVIESPKETIIRLDSEDFDPKKEVILVRELQENKASAISSNLSFSNSQHSALSTQHTFLKYTSDNITLKVSINQGGFLVLGHNLNNNWKVRINNKEDKHFQANLVQRAVYLPKSGEYVIEFYYFPKLFLISLFITCSAILILVLVSILLVIKKNNDSVKITKNYKEAKKVKVNA